MKCKVCGKDFEPVKELHYISIDNETSGVSNVFHKNEVSIYDTFDCTLCGCQNVVGARKRRIVPESEFKKDENFYNTIHNSIGVIEYLSKRVEEEVNSSIEQTENCMSEDESVLEDAKNVLDDLYDLI